MLFKSMKWLSMSQNMLFIRCWKNCRDICESKGHDKIFEMTKGNIESNFPFITFPDEDEVISITEVQLGEDPGMVEGFK